MLQDFVESDMAAIGLVPGALAASTPLLIRKIRSALVGSAPIGRLTQTIFSADLPGASL
jgi:hypothetical protein